MVTATGPIFLRAFSGRSGTNYLRDLLTVHNDIEKSNAPEDCAFFNIKYLEKYAEKLVSEWEKRRLLDHMDGRRFNADILLDLFGRSIIDFFGSGPSSRRLVLKTPGLGDLDAALRIFSDSQIIVLVRDPRSVAVSLAASGFPWTQGKPLEELGAQWSASARQFADFLQRRQDAVRDGRVRIVKYETLVHSPGAMIAGLIAWLGLPPDEALVERACAFPVIGSSFLPRKADGGVNFRPVDRPPDFDPLCRWADWTPEQHRRFNRVCGAMMAHFGYERV